MKAPLWIEWNKFHTLFSITRCKFTFEILLDETRECKGTFSIWFHMLWVIYKTYMIADRLEWTYRPNTVDCASKTVVSYCCIPGLYRPHGLTERKNYNNNKCLSTNTIMIIIRSYMVPGIVLQLVLCIFPNPPWMYQQRNTAQTEVWLH